LEATATAALELPYFFNVAMHLNDSSLFCVLVSLDVTYSPNNLFMTVLQSHSMVKLCYVTILFIAIMGMIHLKYLFPVLVIIPTHQL